MSVNGTCKNGKDTRKWSPEPPEPYEGGSMGDAISVTMSRGSWRAMQEVLLEAAINLNRRGDGEVAKQVMNRLIPAIGWATEDEELKLTEAGIRRHLGLPPISVSTDYLARSLVE